MIVCRQQREIHLVVFIAEDTQIRAFLGKIDRIPLRIAMRDTKQDHKPPADTSDDFAVNGDGTFGHSLNQRLHENYFLACGKVSSAS